MEKTLLRVKELVRKEHNYVITQQVFMYTECSKVIYIESMKGFSPKKQNYFNRVVWGSKVVTQSLHQII